MRSPPTKPEEFYNALYNSQQLSVHDSTSTNYYDNILVGLIIR